MKTKLWVRLLSFGLCLITLLPLMVGCGKNETPDNNDDIPPADSGYMKGHDKVISFELDTENVNTMYILESGDVTAYDKMGLKVDKTTTHDGANASAKWERQDKLTSVSIKAEKRLTDITDYKYVFIWMYSEKATGSKMQFCINCQTIGFAQFWSGICLTINNSDDIHNRSVFYGESSWNTKIY